MLGSRRRLARIERSGLLIGRLLAGGRSHAQVLLQRSRASGAGTIAASEKKGMWMGGVVPGRLVPRPSDRA
jgi:hypothetical protein